MADNKPRGRERNDEGGTGGVNRRGEGLGQGPVGSSGGYSGRPGTGSSSGSQNRASSSSSSASTSILSALLGGKINKTTIIIILVAVVVLFFITGGFKNCSVPSTGTSGLSSFVSSNASTGWTRTANTGKLNTSVASGARDKFTTVKGDGTDTVTMMVYMCGTDLESKGGMASADLAEMCGATLGDNINIIVYTGGCTEWKTTAISNKTNQIWKVESGKIKCLEKDMGNVSMTSPSTLTDFIKWCNTNYPANRNVLVFWDHGGGSLSGYGYDQRFTSSGSMSLAGINTALKNAGVKFDIIGFDACLMATAENALMLSNYADYLVASEETEPGLGWYYTNFLTKLSANTGMSSLEIGKNIADDFTDTCASQLSSAKTTLSVIDLAELSATLPAGLSSFANSTLNLINSDDYEVVSGARSGTREFSSSSKIDQVDLVNLADRMDTTEGKALSEIILSAVKYNRTSSDMTNSYGLSIYFPLQKVSNVDNAVKTYNAIGMNDEYTKCIKSFAALEVAGQVSSGGSSSALGSLTGSIFGGSSGTSTSGSALTSLLTSFIGGNSGISIDGLTSSAASFLDILDINKASSYVSANSLNASDFAFTTVNGKKVVSLSDEKWALVTNIELNVFVDDGQGYIDLGLDNIINITDEGDLSGEYDGMWLALNGQAVAYYHLSTVDDGKEYTITGRIPVLLNGERANLNVEFSNNNPKGIITGFTYDYVNGETDTVAKTCPISELATGTVIEPVADYYSYAGEYQDSYKIGDPITYDGTLKLTDITLVGKTSAVYRITDIYNQHFWTSQMN